MTRNVYDEEPFFSAYAALRRSVEGLDGAPEWPTLRSLVGDVAGLRILDLGCGFGWFCRWAAGRGAISVTGIDRSIRMLDRARAEPHPSITYLRADLDAVGLVRGRFDLIYSSLTFHYLDDLDGLIGRVHAALAPGGSLVFSAEHPIQTAPSRPGFVVGDDGVVAWPVDGYLAEGTRTTDWLTPGVVKHHRTVATYAGFRLTSLIEWGPSEEQVAATPEWAIERERPLFLIVVARAADRPGPGR